MTHPVVKCADPSYHVVSKWDAEVEEKVVAAIALPPTWRARVMGLMQRTTGETDLSSRRSKLEKELEKIRSLYKVDDDYDELPIVLDMAQAITDDADLVHPDLGTNKCATWVYDSAAAGARTGSSRRAAPPQRGLASRRCWPE